jgi:carboxyl-terminal processing protease
MLRKYLYACLLVFVTLGCSEEELTISAEASDYLDEMITIMQANSISRFEIDWDDFRTRVFERAGTAQRIEELNSAIGQALLLLGDNHSLLQRADGAFLSGSLLNCFAPSVGNLEVPNGIGYVRVKGFSGPIDGAAFAYIDDIQEQIRQADTAG